MKRQLYQGGGIMGLSKEGIGGGIIKGVDMGTRTGFFNPFKSVAKVAKKVVGGVKDIASSDLGKAALLAAGAYYAPGFGIKAQGGFGAFGSMLKNKAAGMVPELLKGNTGTALGITALGGLFGGAMAGKSEEEVEALTRDVPALKSYLTQYYTNLNQKAKPEEIEQFVNSQIAEYNEGRGGYAMGGRMQYSDGTMSPDEYFSGKEKYMKQKQMEDMIREYEKYMRDQNMNRDEVAMGGRIGYAEGTEEPLEPINIGIGTFNPQRVVDLYEKAKNIPKNISSKNISLEDIKGIPKILMEGTKSSISSMIEPLGNEYRAYMEFFSLPEKDKKKMEEMGLGIFDVFEYLAMRDNKAQGGRIGFDNGSPRGFDVGNFREQIIQDMIKKSPDGIVMDGERDTFILDSLREEDGDKGLDPSFPPVEYDDGTIYYPKTDEYYKIDGTQVDGISPGAKPVPKVLEAAQGGRIGFKKGGGMDRRGFLKLMGGLAALPIVGKFFKGAKVASKVVPLKGTTTTMPAWFPDLVDKIMVRGIGKKIDADIIEYKTKDLPGITMTKHDDGRIFVEGQNDYGRNYNIEYEPPGVELLDETTGKSVKTKGDFTAQEEVPVNMDPDGNTDFEGEILESVDDILTGDSRSMEGFAKGRKISFKEKNYAGESKVGEAEVAAENRADAFREQEAMDAIDGDDFATGGLAKLLGE